MTSLPESVKQSIESTQVQTQVEGREPRFKPRFYKYDRDIPTKIRPHERDLLVLAGDPPVETVARTSPCPCQTYSDSMPNTPFATEELEKEYWSKLHRKMARRDLIEQVDLHQRELQKYHAQESAAKKGKGKDNGEGSAQKTVTDSSDFDDKRERERQQQQQQQRAGGGTAAESVAERAERKRREAERKRREEERKRRDEEIRVANAQRIGGRLLLPRGPV